MEDLQVALSGIGAPDESSTIIAAGYFSREMIEDLHRHHICGDICMRFFDQYGNLALYEHNQRVIGINIESLRRVPWSIGVAGGVKKANAIKGALAGRYINVLITDIDCAKLLLDE
jgi:DNA-binding transcriptional regulator LsrR (DeoR family)